MLKAASFYIWVDENMNTKAHKIFYLHFLPVKLFQL